MKTSLARSVALSLAIALALASCSSAVSTIPAAGSPSSCAADFAELTPEHTRSPVQIDLNAGYYQGRIANVPGYSYVVHGEFPNSILMTWVIYDEKARIYSAVYDQQVEPDPGSVNPFRAGARVLAHNRSYTLFFHAAGTPVPLGIPASNVLLLPPVPMSGSNRMYVTERSYWSQPGVPRIGGPPSKQPPEIFAVRATEPTLRVACPGTGSGFFTASPFTFPTPIPGRILFFRIPSDLIPLADGTQRGSPCTGYAAAALDPKEVNLVTIHRVPRFPDNRHYTRSSRWRNDFQVRYVGLEANGASVLGPSSDVAMNDISTQSDGSASFMLISRTAPISARKRAELSAYASAHGWNEMPAAKPGLKLFPLPILIYRNKLPNSHFGKSTNAVPCYTAAPWNQAPARYASNRKNMGPYYIDGVICSVKDVLEDACTASRDSGRVVENLSDDQVRISSAQDRSRNNDVSARSATFGPAYRN